MFTRGFLNILVSVQARPKISRENGGNGDLVLLGVGCVLIKRWWSTQFTFCHHAHHFKEWHVLTLRLHFVQVYPHPHFHRSRTPIVGFRRNRSERWRAVACRRFGQSNLIMSFCLFLRGGWWVSHTSGNDGIYFFLRVWTQRFTFTSLWDGGWPVRTWKCREGVKPWREGRTAGTSADTSQYFQLFFSDSLIEAYHTGWQWPRTRVLHVMRKSDSLWYCLYVYVW